MVKTSYQYPQFLYRLQTSDATQQENGSWSESDKTWILHGVCREETNGKGSLINTTDGRTIAFASLVQIPKGTPRIPEGINILITRENVNPSELLNENFIKEAKQTGLIVVQGDCLKYDFGRLHCRLWI